MTENEPKVYDSQIYHDFREMTDVCQSVHAQYGTGGNNMPVVDNERGNDSAPAEDQVAVLQGLKDATDLVCGEDEEMIMTYQALGVNSQGDKASTMKASNNDSNSDLTVKHLTVRRLTPLEAERLQGYPDQYTNIPGATDSKRYKALGNSICLPFWEWLARRFTRYGNVRTIGSLFDGIGGFPLCFKRAGAETLWTSEIEPFCEQVVKYHHDKGEI